MNALATFEFEAVVEGRTERLKIYQNENFSGDGYGLNSEELIVIAWHRRYNIGEKHTHETGGDAKEAYPSDKYWCFPLYMFDHSGLAFSLTDYNDPWDSGQLGFVFVEKTSEFINKERTLAFVQSCVEEQNMIEAGAVYGYRAERVSRCPCCNQEKAGEVEEVDSCWGFVGAQGMLAYIDPVFHDQFKTHFNIK